MIDGNISTWDPACYLQLRPTRALMGLRDWCYRCGGPIYIGDDQTREITIDQIKAELTTREHIPNKKEAKELHQEAAKTRKRPKLSLVWSRGKRF